ncbi:MAG TPA: DUF58 domain-containing protein [Bryobacteraceae bacterium]|jgi:uncharacterized protein (DUF58 family)|nr:DUF58 domain-containing protein [Bryobacteraceae bacterium]
MTIAPAQRLFWLAAFWFLPACALPALVPQGVRYILLAAVVLLVICGFDALLSRRRLDEFTLILPSSIRASLNREQPFTIELRRSPNASSTPAKIRIALALPAEIEPIHDDLIAPAPELQSGLLFEMRFLGRMRGEFLIERAFLGCYSVLGLWQIRRTLPVDATLLVQPALLPIAQETARLLASKLHGGRRIVARNGRGREFEQLREFVPNDDFGDMDWKATARRRLPIVRDYQVERTQDIYAVIDYSRLSGRSVVNSENQSVTVLDEYIRSALMLYYAVREAGDRFGLATFANHIDYFIKSSGAASFDLAFRRALYPLRPRLAAPGYDEICAAFRQRVKRRALIVFFTSLAEPQLAEAFLNASRLLARQHLIVVASPADAFVQPLFSSSVESSDEIYQHLGGHLLWKKLAQVRLQLSTVGIRMHNVTPSRLGLTAATEYLDIKERQLL